MGAMSSHFKNLAFVNYIIVPKTGLNLLMGQFLVMKLKLVGSVNSLLRNHLGH
jgi:hypothetical protein